MRKPGAKIILNGANFCGNVGDLFIFHATVDFLIGSIKDRNELTIDVFPYPLRYDKYVALPSANSFARNVRIKEPVFALRRSVDAFMRRHKKIETFVSNNYWNAIGQLVQRRGSEPLVDEYDHLVSVGGEMDAPYSFLDVHAYIRQLPSLKGSTYGPISVVPAAHKAVFLRNVLADIDAFAVRDPLTGQRLNEIGIENFKVIPDAAFLAVHKWNRVPKNPNGNIGVCLHSRWGYVSGTEEYLQNICKFAKSKGKRVTFFVTNMHEDATLVYRIIQLKKHVDILDVELPRTVDELTTMLGNLDLVISDRLHAILISMIMGTTILPLATRDKLVGYCQYLELENYLDGKETSQTLTKKLSALFEDKANLDRKIASFAKNAYEGVSEYYIQSLSQSFGANQVISSRIVTQ